MRLGPGLRTLFALLIASGCEHDSSTDSAGSDSAGTETSTPACEVEGEPDIAALDEASCEPLVTDYRPLDPGGDGWPACVTDDGEYHLIEGTPGSIARVLAYEDIGDLLWRNSDPTPADFDAARLLYAQEEGLESRVDRREDLHYPPIPMTDWDPGFDGDKQCGILSNQEKYPDRCVGPAKIGPTIQKAFAAGQNGEGAPEVHAARIHAGLLWFLYLSVYKETETCFTSKPADCDSAWAYYNAGEIRGAGLGMAAEVRAQSVQTHGRIYDGILALRCVRDVYPADSYPVLDSLPPTGKVLFDAGWEQLDQALHRGMAVLVRDRLARLAGLDGIEAAAGWAFLQIAGPVLDREIGERDPAAGAELAALWQVDCPTASEIEQAVAILDTVIPCG